MKGVVPVVMGTLGTVKDAIQKWLGKIGAVIRCDLLQKTRQLEIFVDVEKRRNGRILGQL